jgi:hypothetical protein
MKIGAKYQRCEGGREHANFGEVIGDRDAPSGPDERFTLTELGDGEFQVVAERAERFIGCSPSGELVSRDQRQTWETWKVWRFGTRIIGWVEHALAGGGVKAPVFVEFEVV